MPHTCKHDAETLKQLQALPLKAKVFETRQRIAEWVKHYGVGGVYVAFSGGKDSTVLLDIVRRDYPEIPAVFCDTGLEFPEIRDFVKTIDNVTWLKPKMTFKAVIEKYGAPVVSKKVAQYVYEVNRSQSETATKRLRLTGIRSDGSYLHAAKIPQKWMFLLDADFGISHKCCDVMKKDPAKHYEKQTGRLPILGTMAGESRVRRQSYLMNGCNAFELKRPRSAPISFWTELDIWGYIHKNKLPHCSIYNRGWDRTGCMFCAFGCHNEETPNRFQRMHDTHPKQWKYCMDKLGMREVLEFCGIPVEDKQLKLDLGD